MTLKQYLLFSYHLGAPSDVANSCGGDFDTIEEAQVFARRQGHDRCEIFDLRFGVWHAFGTIETTPLDAMDDGECED